MSQLQVTGEAKVRDIQGPVVANSGVITALDGDASQYVRGDGTLADFPTSTGGGSSVSYYLNSSVSQGTIGGVAYRELSKEPIIGAGTDIAISANGYVANYITDVNDPDVVLIPGGNFNCEFYFSVNNNSGNPFFYAELYKYDGTTFTLLGSSVGVPEYITQGTTIAPYYFAIPVATANLALTDRLAIRIYVNVSGRTITLHTENGHLCQVVTTLSKGMVSLNNLTDQSQYLTTGTSGTDFNIVSSGDTHTFNIPSASASNRGLITTGSQTIAGAKVFDNPITANSGIGFLNGVMPNITSNLYSGIGGNSQGISIITRPVSTNYTNNFYFPSASNSYTFPNATGTIALTSDIPSLAGYVPYTGATTNVNLGVYSLTANKLIAGSASTDNVAIFTTYDEGKALQLKGSTGDLLFVPLFNPATGARITAQNTAGSAYTPLSFFASNFYFHSNVNFNSTLGNGTYTYTLPSATGILALTSNLSAYLPLTGGTLTGALNINLSSGTAINVAGDAIFRGDTGVGTPRQLTITSGGSTPVYLDAKGYGANYITDFGIRTYNSSGVAFNVFYGTSAGDVGIGNTAPAYKLDVNGTGRFTGALTGTSATFNTGTGATFRAIYDSDNITEIGNYSAASGYRQLNIVASTINLATGTAGGGSATTRLTIASTGAATFSSSVTAGGDITIPNGNYYYARRNTGGSAINVMGFASGSDTLTIRGGTSGATVAMQFQDTGGTVMSLYNGNVGIGTSSPATKLHIETASQSYGQLRITSTSNNTGEASINIGRTDQTIDNRWTIGQGTASIGDTFGFYTAGSNKGTLTTAGVWSTTGGGTSDARTKEDIDYKFDNGVESVLKLQPTKFKFKNAPDKQRRGFIAQDVLEVIPDLVLGDGEKENGTYGLDYDGILALAVKAIQESHQIIKDLEARIVTLESKLN